MHKHYYALISLFFFSSAFAANFTLSSTDFAANGKIPARVTCEGQNVSPELHWANTPAHTQSFALILSDPDAPNGTFYHWIVYNIPGTIAKFAPGIKEVPVGLSAGKNSWDNTIYKGPCPPKGVEHRYVFTLFALDNKIDAGKHPDARTLMDAMQHHIIERATLTGTFDH